MQTVWKGVISFGLVSIPVQLFAATEEHSVTFRQIHASDGGQIRYRRVCTLDDEEVSYGDIARGYELPDGQVVMLTDEDFAQLPLVTSRAIEVLGFADADSVDPVRLSRSYYCDPTGSDTKGYVLLRDALRRTGKVALVKVALRGRESPAVLHPRDGVLVLHLLLWQDEVRQPRFKFLQDQTPPRARELEAAEAYIHTLTDMPEPHDMVDRYQAALRELVEAKVTGRRLEQPPALAAAGQGESLMEALRRSVEQARQDRADTRPAPRKRAAKPAASRQAGAKPPAKPAAGPPPATATGATTKSLSRSSSGKKPPAKNTPAKRTSAEKSAKNR
ncbi:MAG TPA: Ku protein [Mycobacteriales bacterium]